MTPGPELDALIAEKVMGWSQSTHPKTKPGWLAPPDNLEGLYDPSWIKPYSTDISVAWQVVERMEKRGRWIIEVRLNAFKASFLYSLGLTPAGPTREFYGDSGVGAESMPHAICLAALKAVGYDLSQHSTLPAPQHHPPVKMP